MASSQKRKFLTLEDKIKLIAFKNENSGVGIREIGEKFGVGKTQVSSILNEKEKLMKLWETNTSANIKRKKRPAMYEEINHAVFDWFCLARCSNVPISGPMIQQEAKEIAERLNIDNFKASNGWLEKWKHHYNIANFTVSGEEGDVNEETVESWSERLREITKPYELEDIWNLDETGFFWKALPEKSLSKKGERCKGDKKSKQRLTALFIVSATGEKEEPIIVGKSASPRCFKSLKDKTRPYRAFYYHNNKAWMTSELMQAILQGLNRRFVAKKRKILLFMDNAPCHPVDLDGMFSNIKVVFLPKNTTSRLQPLDAGIIKNFKVFYRRFLLRHVVARIDGSNTATDIVKSVDVLLAIKWAVEAWKLVTIETIQNCFALCGFSAQSVHQEQEDDDPFNELNDLVHDIDPECSAEEYLRTDQEVPITDEPIDLTNPNWRDNLREKILEQVHTDILSENDTLKSTDLSSDEEVDNFDVVPVEPK